MNRFIRSVCLLTGVALACSLVAQSISEPVSAAKTRLVVYWHQGGESLTQLRMLLDAYEKKNPSVQFMVSLGDGDWTQYYQKMLIMMSAGVQMDLCQIDMQYVPYALKGVFADLTPYVKKSKLDVDDISKVAWKAYSVNTKQFGLPWASFVSPIVYNKKLFGEAGLVPLPADWTDTSFTTDAIERIGEKLTRDTNGDGQPDTYGIGPLWDFQWSFGGDWVDETGKKAIANSPENIAAFKWYVSLIRDKHIKPDTANSTRIKLTWDPFRSGKIGMATWGTWGFPDYSRLKFPWDVAVTPMKSKRYVTSSVDALAIGTRSKYKDEAWKLLKYLADTDDGLAKLSATMCGVPVQKSTWGRYYESLRKKYSNINWQSVIDSVDYARFSGLYVTGRRLVLDPIINAEQTKMEDGKKGVPQALDDIQKRLVVELTRR